MRIVKPPFFSTLLFADAVWNYSRLEEKYFLTFDDGPSEATPIILDLLDQYKIKATFFCVGKQVEKYPNLFQQIILRGHTIGNHSYSHLNGWKTSKINYINDVKNAASMIPSKLFRPPYGKVTPWQFHQLKKHFKIIFWDVLSYDFDKHLSKEDCAMLTMKNIKKGSIIVFHDRLQSIDNTVFCIQSIVKKIDVSKFQRIEL